MRAAAAPGTDAPALPPLFRHHVRRPRLTRLLDESRARIIVLTAPAGYGKTTLAAEWLQGRPKEEVAWYYASPASADVAALSVGIAEAVSHILPAGERVKQRLRVPQVPDNAADILAELLSEDLKTWPESAWLVLDDYHHAMESQAAERFVAELLRLAPLRVLVTTRRRPSWVTAKRVVYGEIVELGRDELAMTHEETTAVLSSGLALPPAPGDFQSYGWPALVGLVVLAQTSKLSSAALVGNVLRYIADEVLRHESPEMQRFMLVAAIPPYLDRKVTQTLPVAIIPSAIESLADRGLLQTAAHGRAVFHPLLRNVLRERVEEDDPALAAETARRVLDHFLTVSEWDGALRLASEVDDAPLIARVITEASDDLLNLGRLDTLDRWIAAIPERSRNDDDLVLLKAEIALRRRRFRECAALSEAVAARVPPASPTAGKAWVLHARARHLLCEHKEALLAFERALAGANDAALARQVAWGRFIAANELSSDDVANHFAEFAKLPEADPNHRLRVAAGRALVNCHLQEPIAVRRAVGEALALLELATDPLAISYGFFVSVVIGAHGADYDEAIQRAARAMTYCQSLRLDFAYAYTLAYRTAAEIGIRSFDNARGSLREMTDLLVGEDAHFALLRSIIQLKLAIGTASHTRQSPSLSAALLDSGHLPPAPAAELLALEALVHAAAEEVELSISKSAMARSLSRDHGPRLYSDFAAVIRDFGREGESPDLSLDLARALDLSERTSSLDVFVTAYRCWPRFLQLIPDEPRPLMIARRAIRAGRDEGIVRRLPQGRAGLLLPSEGLAVLTPREAEVASLIAQGLSNVDIAARLFIAPSTAKVHVRHILKKLGARTRIEAALRWRDLSER